MARHVITGGAGFVATRLAADLAAQGQTIVLFDLVAPTAAPASASFVQGDIRNPADLAKLGLGPDDTVHHMAARQFHGGVPADGRDEWFADVNVAGTRRVLEAMSAGGAKRLVFFSTDMTYGPPKQTPVPADHPQNPIGPYGRSKLAAEQLMRGAAADFGLAATVFRPRLISGAGRLGILGKLFALIQRSLPVPMIGAGNNRYQMIAVEDCAAAAMRAAELGCPAGAFNLGSNDPPTVRELLGRVIERAGSKSMLIPTPGFAVKQTLAFLDLVGLTLLYPEQYGIADLDYLLDTSVTTERFGWSPTRRDEDIIFEAYAAATGKAV